MGILEWMKDKLWFLLSGAKFRIILVPGSFSSLLTVADMEPSRSIPVTSSASVSQPLITSSSLASNMLSPLTAPHAGQEIVIIKNSQQIEGIPMDHCDSHAAAILDPTPVRLSGEYKESEFGMLLSFFYLVAAIKAYLSYVSC